MTTLLIQQLLLYMLLALLLPRATYEQIRYDNGTSQRRFNLTQVNRIVRDIQEKQLLEKLRTDTTNKKQVLRSGSEIQEGFKLIVESKKAKNKQNDLEKSASLQRENEFEKIMQKRIKTKAEEKVQEVKKQVLSISKNEIVRQTNRKRPMLIIEHNPKLITRSEQSQNSVQQAQTQKTHLFSIDFDKKKNQFADSSKQQTIQVPENKKPKSQSGNFPDQTESKVNLFVGVSAILSSSVRIKRQPQLKQQSTQSTSSIRLPQPQAQHQSIELNDFHSQLSLPAVPMPAPPPFPSSFSITPFGGATSQDVYKFPNAFAGAASSSSSSSSTVPSCGGILKQPFGIIQTPNFPRKFSVPLECIWIIDASELSTTATSNAASSSASASMPSTNVSIVVYLTQLYVLGGLKFTEYMYYSDDYKVPSHRVFQLNEDDVTQVASVQFNSQYLEIRFTMSSLDGTHLRALDRLLDVYGFNITYEVHHETKPYQCNTLQCRFLGHCFARADFSSYYCACFSGFSGTDCGRGPLCEDPHTNICQNGGTCKHIGDAAITCHCPAGYKGTKCEIPEINEITMGCTANSTSNDCHQECNFEHIYADAYSLAKVGRTLARSGKTRYEVTIRLGANLTAYYRATDADRRPGDHLPSLLEKHVSAILTF